MKKCMLVGLIFVMVLNLIIPSAAFSQAAATVMTLANGTPVTMTSAQLAALTTGQPGIAIASTATVTATQVAIPIPAALGSGYIVGTPAAIASGLSATGIATGVTASAVVGATAAAGTIITAGAMAGAVATLGVGGTVAVGTAVAGAVVGGVAAATSGGSTTTTTHH